MSRLQYLAAAVATIAAGLFVHLRGTLLGSVLQDVLGDALWAAMISWGFGALMPRVGIGVRSAAAFTLCVLVELSQRYHTPSLDALRATAVGQLVLGSSFDPRDIAAYAAGVMGALLLERLARYFMDSTCATS